MSAQNWLALALSDLDAIKDAARTEGADEAAKLAEAFLGRLSALVHQFNIESFSDSAGEAVRRVARDRTDWPLLVSRFKNNSGSLLARFDDDGKAWNRRADDATRSPALVIARLRAEMSAPRVTVIALTLQD